MRHLTASLLTACSALLLSSLAAPANPLGPEVTAGTVSVGGEGTTNVTVTQQSDKAIIDWRSFDIALSESMTFAQPDASSVTLNRVTGGLGPSQILGTLKANGQIFLVNPDGILVGKDATIDVGALVATTHDLFDGDFLKGSYHFGLSGNPAASVVNLGKITVSDGGFAALVAPGVRNAGTITARLGKVALGSGQSFSLDPYGDDLIKLGVIDDTASEVIDLSTGKPLSTLVGNDGNILADGGLVQLTASATRKIIDSVVNNTGFIEADTVGTRNGKIVLSAATSGTTPSGAPAQVVKVSGKLSASGRNSGETGGDIEITGEQIALAEATIDAFGWNGGGQVLVGGDHGHHIEASALPQPPATETTVDAGSNIDGSAASDGDGGKVVVWSDGDTTFGGIIAARGGVAGGNGGFVETSGRQHLAYTGTVDLSASKGSQGTLLLDPLDVSIGTIGDWVVTPASIVTTLATSNVVVKTSAGAGSGDITVAQPINWATANSLTLSAARNIAVDAAISNSAGANVVLRADDEGTGVGTVTFGTGGSVATTGDVALYYNPSVNPPESLVNSNSYVNPTENFAPYVTAASITPYMLVNSVQDLQNIRNNLSGNYALGGDISASGTAIWNAGLGFIPIGTRVAPFSGIFDGGENRIMGVAISSFGDDVGLFGDIGGTIAHLKLTDADVVASKPGGTSGVLAGRSSGVVYDVTVTGHLEGDSSQLVSCGSGCSTIYPSQTGGLIGINTGTVALSAFEGTILDPGSYNGVGGLVGENTGLIVNSSTAGTITTSSGYGLAGGLVGSNEGLVFRSSSSADVDASAAGSGDGLGGLGGLAGGNSGPYGVYQSYSRGSVTGKQLISIGGLVGVNSASISASYSEGQVTGGNYSQDGALVGSDFHPYQVATIDQAYATGHVSGTSPGTVVPLTPCCSYSLSGSVTGGLTGNGYLGSTITNAYWDTDKTGQLFAGYGVSGATGLSTELLTSQLPVGFDLALWGIDPMYNGGYPYLLWQRATPSAPSVTVLAPIAGQSGHDETLLDYRPTPPTPSLQVANSTAPIVIPPPGVPEVDKTIARTVLPYAEMARQVEGGSPNVTFANYVPDALGWDALLRQSLSDAGAPSDTIEDIISIAKAAGFYAALYDDLGTGETVVVFRGSISLFSYPLAKRWEDDWAKTDFPELFGNTTDQYDVAEKFVAALHAAGASNLTLVGFSKGGGQASAAAWPSDKVITFDGARNADSVAGKSHDEVNIYVPYDIVSDPTFMQDNLALPGKAYWVTSNIPRPMNLPGQITHSMDAIIGGLRAKLAG